MAGVVVLDAALPSDLCLIEGETLQLPYGVSAAFSPAASVRQSGTRLSAELKWLGLFSVKQVAVQVVAPTYVIPCGTPFGIKLYTEGVLVVGMSDVDTAVGLHNPARAAGLRVGDIVLKANGTALTSMQDLASVVEASGGRALTLRIKRDGVAFDVRFCPAFSVAENAYKAGLWVRDSSAGIGTMTFYHPDSMTFAGLGHAVCDVDTGQILPISAGQAVPARIYSVQAGQSGVAGELCGAFEGGTLGSITHNGVSGLYGTLQSRPTYAEPIAVAMRQQVQIGAAEVITTVDGVTPQRYTVNIERVRYNDPSCRDMVIRITDERLLNKTGGIVQGMSGSPIIQDGRIIGAVTHVFVSDPTQGCGVYIDWMLGEAGAV